MKRLIPRLRHHERGAVLVWVAGALVAFLGFSALAVDLGFLYLRTTQLQNAADAAATAGVVNIPTDPDQANTDAHAAAAANGFPQPTGADITTVLDDNSLEVTLETTVPTFLLRALGRDQFDVVRTSRAEFIKPVRLGSPEGTFGSVGQDFWAAINGQYTDREQGDPYSTRCIEANESLPQTCTTANGGDGVGFFRPGGYYYGVEVAPGTTSLTVSFYDPGHFLTSGGGTRPFPATGDTSWRWPGGSTGVNLQARLYRPDTTINDPTDNDVLVPGCSNTSATYAGPTPTGGFAGYQQWVSLCSISSPDPGLYVLQLPAPQWEGSSKFGIRATTSGGGALYEPAKLFGLLDMSIHVNRGAGNPQPWLAEVLPVHAGKTFEVDIFDIGESDTMTLEIRGPGDTPVACRWTSSKASEASGSGGSLINPCRFDVGSRRFNGDWLYLEIPLADDYTCTESGTGCWWRVDIDNMSNPTDRTTWAARIAGNPIRLNP